MSRPRTILVFGAGPGIGNNTAIQFASKGLSHIVLLARTQRLTESDAPSVRSSAPNAKVSTVTLDLANLDSIPSVLKQLDELTKDEDVEVVFFNAARIKPSEVLGVSVDEIHEDLKVTPPYSCSISSIHVILTLKLQTTTLSLYLIAQHFIPKLTSLAKSKSLKPTFLVTSSHLPWDPVPQLLSLSLTKAAQRNMVQSFALAFKDSGVKIGVLSVEGEVKPENKVLNPKTIAERAVGWWERGEGWEVSVKE
jgi:NAD(P)-dependent dehydrogenase (short-subunit alcohol dehydrogenase family)